ncbi:hypothetical protein CANARDRAFT_74446 [[Candida] arabinofermentans NRRL YB-2248]|uniref:Uncharacterized protein n=1 Tax=[Candida] arabinofermentans NRRL YB-2248 TaxID=983967 RepID=A0A1E4SWQ7_9ASCO|nr:hypothetical protein CANARDRAFT_74446 [[Candida] arabinofermentans NRRL YB-2248]
MEKLDTIFKNTVNHITSVPNTGKKLYSQQYISPLSVAIKYYFTKLIQNPHLHVKHITTTSDFDVEVLIAETDKLRTNMPSIDMLLGKITYNRAFDLTSLYGEVDSLVNLEEGNGSRFDIVVIEDLCDIFNVEFFKNYTYGNELSYNKAFLATSATCPDISNYHNYH